MRASSTSDGDAAHQPCPIESPEDDDDFSNLVRPWRPVRPRRVYARHRWQRACYLCGLTSVTIAAWLLKLSHGRSEPAGPASPHAAAPEKPALTCPGLGGLTGTRSPDGAAAFLGIPYATPPLGEARWRPPRRGAAGPQHALRHRGQLDASRRGGAAAGAADGMLLGASPLPATVCSMHISSALYHFAIGKLHHQRRP